MASDQLQLAQDLRAAIYARALGRQVQSASGSGRSVSYGAMTVSEMIALYDQTRAQCTLAEQALLPPISPLDLPGPSGRGRPLYYRSRPWA